MNFVITIEPHKYDIDRWTWSFTYEDSETPGKHWTCAAPTSYRNRDKAKDAAEKVARSVAEKRMARQTYDYEVTPDA